MSIKSKVPMYTIPGEKKFLITELTVYVILSILISGPVVLLMIARLPPDFKTGDIESFSTAMGSLTMLYGFGPIISATIVTLVSRGKSGLKELFSKVITWKVSVRWYLWALLLPVIPQWIGLFLWAHLTDTALVLPALTSYLSSWLQISLVATAYYITEEVGWRGFMLPRMLFMNSWIKASLLMAIIWGIWHYPLWIFSTWSTTGSVAEVSLMVTANTVYITALTMAITWIFKNTRGSILFAMLLHGSNQANLTKMYAAAGDSALHGSSFIVVEAVTVAVTVILLLFVVRNKNNSL